MAAGEVDDLQTTSPKRDVPAIIGAGVVGSTMHDRLEHPADDCGICMTALAACQGVQRFHTSCLMVARVDVLHVAVLPVPRSGSRESRLQIDPWLVS